MTTVTFVGTGSAFSRRFGHSNALVRNGDQRLMIDFGYHSPARLAKLEVGLGDLSHVVISHLHADHTGGLEELAFTNYFVHRKRLKLLAPTRVLGPLWDTCLRGGLERISDSDGGPLRRSLADYFEVRALEEGRWHQVGSIEMRPFFVDHVPEKDAYGFLVRDPADGSQFIYTGDTRTVLPQLMDLSMDPDFERGPIFHDCQLYDGGSSTIHISLDRLQEYSPEIRDRLVLTHYGDNIGEHLERIDAAGLRVVWPGCPIQLAGWRESLESARAPED